MPKPTFAYHRLEAYRAALDLADAGHRLARRIPRGYGWLADHLVRAACATPVLTAEGANRVSPRKPPPRPGLPLARHPPHPVPPGPFTSPSGPVRSIIQRGAKVQGSQGFAPFASRKASWESKLLNVSSA